MILALKLLATAALCVAVLQILERWNLDRHPLLVQADYQRCTRVDPGPLQRPTKPVLYPRNSTLA